jgi:hypothetical protein
MLIVRLQGLFFEDAGVMDDSVGILVHGDNHFIVRGPQPDRATAFALVRHWSVIQIGATTPPALDQWRITSKEFRENLAWAIIVPGDSEPSSAVAQLLSELTARGVAICNLAIYNTKA